MKLLLPLLLLGAVVLAEKIGDKVNIKINDVSSSTTYGSTNWQSGGGTTTNTYNTYTPPVQTPVLARQPASFALPALYDSLSAAAKSDLTATWSALEGRCYSTVSGEYTYELCPFRNVTQKRASPHLHVVMGIWGVWLPSTDTAAFAMKYTDGNACSSGKHRSTTVRISCENSALGPRVAHVAEVACEYTIDFYTALVCPEQQPAGVDVAPAAVASTDAATTGRSQTSPCRSTVEAMQTCIDYLLSSKSAGASTASSPCADFVGKPAADKPKADSAKSAKVEAAAPASAKLAATKDSETVAAAAKPAAEPAANAAKPTSKPAPKPAAAAAADDEEDEEDAAAEETEAAAEQYVGDDDEDAAVAEGAEEGADDAGNDDASL